MPFTLQVIAIVIIVSASLLPFALPNWRVLISALTAVYLIQFIFIFYQSTPLLAVINLIIGWMACAIIGISSLRLGLATYIEPPGTGITFRLISAFFFILTAFALSINAYTWLSKVPYILLSAGLTLLFTGMLQMSFYHHVLRVIISLLVFLAGFELIYYSLESSLLVIILIGLVKIGLAFTGTYLIALENQMESV
jgi:hypothetical protein